MPRPVKYLSFKAYQESGGTLDEAEFEKAEGYAETLIDHWTLNRLRVDEVWDDLAALGLDSKVEIAMIELVDRVPSIIAARKAKAEGSEVTSFSNGVNSFGFGSGSTASGMTQAESEAYAEVCYLLPVELVSACVSYNHAR